jgi:hypothetical protein
MALWSVVIVAGFVGLLAASIRKPQEIAATPF